MKQPKEVKKINPKEVWGQPIHPGEILRRRFFEPLAKSQVEFCAEYGIDPSNFSRILNGTQKITAKTANQFSEAFGMSAMFFMNLQSQHDLRSRRKKTE